ncbi:hypothetical protein [Crinalium epipsammum]|nr:hypothetical protein [Crinalium epipsammum]
MNRIYIVVFAVSNVCSRVFKVEIINNLISQILNSPQGMRSHLE